MYRRARYPGLDRDIELCFQLFDSGIVLRNEIGTKHSRDSCPFDTPRPEDKMNKLALAFALGATALFATAATAAPLAVNPSVGVDNSNIQNVRMVCNEEGRC